MAHMSGKTMYGNLEHKFLARVQLNPINEQTRKERSFSPLLVRIYSLALSVKSVSTLPKSCLLQRTCIGSARIQGDC